VRLFPKNGPFFTASVKNSYLTRWGWAGVLTFNIKGLDREKNLFREHVKKSGFLRKSHHEHILLCRIGIHLPAENGENRRMEASPRKPRQHFFHFSSARFCVFGGPGMAVHTSVNQIEEIFKVYKNAQIRAEMSCVFLAASNPL
jgi:hypothetical protein